MAHLQEFTILCSFLPNNKKKKKKQLANTKMYFQQKHC